MTDHTNEDVAVVREALEGVGLWAASISEPSAAVEEGVTNALVALDRLQARLEAAEAEVVARTWTCFACSEARERMHVAEDALAAAKADAERLKAPWLCDCHTWPGPDEAHDYIVALEADAERLAEALARVLDIESGFCAPTVKRDWDAVRSVATDALAAHTPEGGEPMQPTS